MLFVHVLDIAIVHFRLVLVDCWLVYNVVGSCTEFSFCSF